MRNLELGSRMADEYYGILLLCFVYCTILSCARLKVRYSDVKYGDLLRDLAFGSYMAIECGSSATPARQVGVLLSDYRRAI